MEPESTLSLGGVALNVGIVVILVLANAFFVAAEFALVGSRRSRIDALAAGGGRSARLARRAIQNVDHYISGTQLGITFASLGLGWVGERTVAAVLVQLFGALPEPWSIVASHAVAIPIAFVLLAFLHIVLGELVPKSIALLFPERVSLWTAGPLMLFSRLFGPFIAVLNGAAALLLRLLGLRPPSGIERVHRPEELELLLTQSYEHGLMAEQPVDMIRGVFDLSEISAAEVMTPRTEIVGLPLGSTVQQAATLILEEGHSRIPIFEDSHDRIVGMVLAREVWQAQQQGRDDLLPLIRPLSFVPDTKPIESLLREMLAGRTHMAVVVDEFGGTAGIVTLEDLVEEIVGEIMDEDDEDPTGMEETASGEVLLDGLVPIFDLNEEFELGLPEDEYTTVGGYVMSRLGRVPRPGDEVVVDGGRFRVLSMDARRIDRLSFFPDPNTGRPRTPRVQDSGTED